MPLVERLLRKQRVGLAMAQVAWRRANQFGDFMAVLEFRAVNLDDRAGIAEERFRNGFHYARLTGAGWAKKKQVSHRTPGSVQPREKHLVNFHHFRSEERRVGKE